MICVNCRWYNEENEVCLKDGYSVFNPDADNPCEYADNMTVFERITASPEVLAEKLLYAPLGEFCKLWYSTVLPGEHWNVKAEAIAATVAKLKEVCDE